jgi:carboxyl-terminal processing protease
MSPLQWQSCLLLVSTLALSACGGGGSAGTTVTPPTPNPGTGTGNTPVAPDWVAGQFPSENSLKNYCAAPRSGVDPYTNAAFPDRAGTAMHEKMWLRSWSNRTYLWYRELADINPVSYTTPKYFELLRTTTKTPSGADKDNFHFSENTAAYLKQTEGGVVSGYGISWKFGAVKPPRDVQIAYTEPTSPAVTQNLGRGAKLLEIDGIDFVNDNTQAGVDKINAGLFPAKAGESHQFTFVDPKGVRKTYTLLSADIATSAVQNVKVLSTPVGNVGYLQFNTHIANAQPQLISAINQFNNSNINELVIDLRYNGGGLLALASQFAYMVAGPNVIQNRIFERTMFNDKYPTTDPVNGGTIQPMPFYNRGIDYQAGQFTNQVLPNVSLRRIFVLSTDNTCSASEAFINGLRGVDLDVVLIGSQTCGKPYGFYPTDNCGTTYFTIQFSGVNAKGFGDFADGFKPTPTPQFTSDVKGCAVADDLTQPLGDSREKMLSTALYYMGNNGCPVTPQSVASKLAQSAESLSSAMQRDGLAIQSRDPRRDAVIFENKLLQPNLPPQSE